MTWRFWTYFFKKTSSGMDDIRNDFRQKAENLLRKAREISTEENCREVDLELRDFIVQEFGEGSREYQTYLHLRTPQVINSRPQTYNDRVANELSNFQDQLVGVSEAKHQAKINSKKESLIDEIEKLMTDLA